MASIKISNLHNHKNEFVKRLRGKNIMGKAKMLKALKAGDMEYVYQDLLYRIEAYTEVKALNYTRADIKKVVLSVFENGAPAIASALVEKLEAAGEL